MFFRPIIGPYRRFVRTEIDLRIKGLQNQKDNVNVTLFCLYDCIAFDVDWPRHNTGNG